MTTMLLRRHCAKARCYHSIRKFFDSIPKEDGIEWTVFRLGGVTNDEVLGSSLLS